MNNLTDWEEVYGKGLDMLGTHYNTDMRALKNCISPSCESANKKSFTTDEVFKMVEDILSAHYGVPIKSK
jgi:hypothetical protein